MRSIRFLTVSALLYVGTLPAFAHPGLAGHSHDGWAGLLHPFSGADHVLAMLAVGFWAALVNGPARLVWPLGFVAFVAVGAVLGASGVTLPVTEAMVAASVAALGLMVAFGWQASLTAGLALCAVFGLTHGLAHGAEIPQQASGVAYTIGFLAATALLHGCGLAIGSKAGKITGKLAGLSLAMIGTGLFAGTF